MDYIILSAAQIKELLSDVDAKVEKARQEGYEAGRAAEADYDQGYEHGFAAGEDRGYNDGAADSYDDGYEDGRAEAELRAAESAAFDEPPRIHEWREGTRLFD